MENFESQNKKLILVVDDEEINRELLGNILHEKYKVEYACDGEEAMQCIRRDRNLLSCILLDLNMPKKGGLEVLAEIRADEVLSHIPVSCRTDASGWFFEGDIPMMLVYADVASGTKKREAKSEAFMKSPFTYRMYPTPVTDKGGIFISNTGTGFAVNSKGKELAMTNEFIRFLTQTKELNNLAYVKHLIPITKDFSSDELFAPMENGIKVYANTTSLSDDVQKQIRGNCSGIANKTKTVDQAVKGL